MIGLCSVAGERAAFAQASGVTCLSCQLVIEGSLVSTIWAAAKARRTPWTEQHLGRRGLGCWTFQSDGRRRSRGLSTRERNPRSISDPQEILPPAQLPFETHALRNPKRRNDAPLDLLPDLPAVSHANRNFRRDR